MLWCINVTYVRIFIIFFFYDFGSFYPLFLSLIGYLGFQSFPIVDAGNTTTLNANGVSANGNAASTNQVDYLNQLIV